MNKSLAIVIFLKLLKVRSTVSALFFRGCFKCGKCFTVALEI